MNDRYAYSALVGGACLIGAGLVMLVVVVLGCLTR